MQDNKSVIVIPARMQATRFPNKPLADTDGIPMIVRVMQQAMKSQVGEVYIACGDIEIAEVVEKYGGNAILTDNDLPSGSDRIYQALMRINKSFDRVINVQGDIPTIDPMTIQRVASAIQDCDISTACAKIVDVDEINNPNVVKCYANFQDGNIARASDFNREAFGNPPYYHHIGLYGYTASALKKFVALSPTENELNRKLEQMRALDNNMTINAVLVDDVPLGVDTPDDLEKILCLLQK